MSAPVRRRLLQSSLVLLVVADLLLLVSFVFNQWFAVSFWQVWGLAALLAMPLTMLVLPLVEAVTDGPKTAPGIGFSGDKIPGAGQ